MKTLKKFNNFVEQILQSNSRNYKLNVLEQFKNDNDIKYYLNFIYDPYKITGISDKKLNKLAIYTSTELPFNTIQDCLNYILEHNTGTDHVLNMLGVFKQTIPEDLKELFDKIITKNLQIGIDTKSINKIFPGLIPQFQVQLANKYFDDPSKVNGKEIALTCKIDGMRCILIKKNNKTTFWSRQGQPIEGLVDLITEADEFMPNNIALDGELIAKETSKADTYKNTMKTARTKDAEKHNLKMMVFDYMSASEFENQYCPHNYNDRRYQLNSIFSSHDFEYFNLLPILYQGKDTTKIEEILNEQVSNGEEGIMINIVDAGYDFKRTNNLLKVKLMQTLDLQIVDYFEGDNSNTGKLGGFIVRYKNGNLVRVGSGYSKEFREEAWSHPDDYIGKIISVQYFEETENANGGLSLRFPVFIDFRDSWDKAESDF